MTWLGIGFAFLVANTLLVAPASQAQSQNVPAAPGSQGSATLRGTVQDSQNHPAVDAIVYLKTTGSGQTAVTHSDSQGSYRFSELQAGSYSLRAEKGGLGNAESDPFLIESSETKQVNLTLKAQSAAEAGPTKTKPAFFDEPNFTVAGVTDSTYLGGHGSGGTCVQPRRWLRRPQTSVMRRRRQIPCPLHP